MRSRSGNAHLGQAFTDGPEAAGGLRYCINSQQLCDYSKKMKQKDTAIC